MINPRTALVDNRAWLEAVKNSDNLDSLYSFLESLEIQAKNVAMDPTCSEVTWRACQTYTKWCKDIKVFIYNFLNEQENRKVRKNGMVEQA